MILTAGLSKPYWEEAVATACYLQNRIPHSIDPEKTPYFHWFGKIPDLQHLRVFGCGAYPIKAADTCKKLDATTSTRMIFVGYGDRFGVKAYRLYDTTHHKFHFAHSVYFDEASLLGPQEGDATPVHQLPSSQPSKSKAPLLPLPQVEWEEPDQILPLPPLPNPVPSSQQGPPISPNPIRTP